jgi:NarL family two-component system response regulator LiaR
MTNLIRILIVDDHAVVRQGLRTFLDAQEEMRVVGEAESGVEAVEMASELEPDIVIMDLIMPDMEGVEATSRLKRACPQSRVIVFTSYHKDEHIFPAIRAGALSYVLKDARPEELADVVRKAVQGEAVLHPRVAARVVQEVHGTRGKAVNPFTELSARELEVLRLIAGGLSNAEIAEVLVIGEKTVKTHVSNILGKLHLGDRTQAAVYAWRHGIVRRD